MSKQIVSDRFAEAGLDDARFVSVKDGAKMCVDHDTRYSTAEDVPGGNYGLYADEDDQLVVLDVDVHRDGSEADRKPIAALGRLPLTLTIQSPHADEDVGGHRLYRLEGDETPAELFDRVFGRKNPVPSWGEVVSKNKYVVGAGSQLNGCTKDWCDSCDTEDGGRYTVKDDREIATVTADDLVAALDADPDLERNDKPDHSDISQYDDADRAASSSTKEYDDLTRSQVEELLEAVPGDQHFDDWIRTGYAVYSWNSGDEGKELFESWSRDNKKWEKQESQRQVDYIWRNGDDTDSDNNASVGTLIHIARDNGYDGDLGSKPQEPDDDSDELTWNDVRGRYAYAEQESDYPKGNARLAAADLLEDETSWMYVLESERLWVYDESTGQYQKHGGSHARNRLEGKLNEFYSEAERREIVARLEARNQVHREVINARQRDDPLLCVGNGVVNMRTGELLDHDPKYRFVRGLSIDYAATDADPEKVIDFLDDVTEREADRDTLIDHLAHGLMPGHPYRAFVVTYGPGGNGKTQVAELFRGFVGKHNAAAVEIDELADGDFATGDLPGKFINWGDDMAGDGGGKLKDLSLLKKATGGSEIRANEKYEKTFNFKNEAAMFFSANEPPRIGEQKRSVQDRIYPIEMPNRFVSDPDPDNPLEKEKTPNVSKKLLEDDAAMKGLLLLAVQHGQQLIESRGQYSQPESPEERLEKYNQSADPIVKFGGKAVEQAGGDYLIRKDDAHTVYRSFAEAWEERVASERGFKRQFAGSLPWEIETARSRALASSDDGEERVRCWKRLKWTDSARGHMPEWMVERYADHFDSATPAATDAEPSDTTTEEEDEEEGEKRLTPEAINLSEYDDREPLPALVATPSHVWEGDYSKPVTELMGEGVETVDLRFEGFPEPDLTPVTPGKEHEFTRLRVRNRDGERPYVEYRPTSSAVLLETPTVDNTGESDEETATDGGEEGIDADEESGGDDEVNNNTTASGVDGKDMKPLIQMYFDQQPGDVEHDDLVEHLREKGAIDEQIEHWINKLRTRKGLILEPEEEGVYRWGGR